MIALTPASVRQYLVERCFLDSTAAVATPYEVTECIRRNRNLLVRAGGGDGGARGYLVKQVKTWREEFTDSLAREANCYWRSTHDPRFQPLRALMPACHAWDPENSILIFELLPLAPLTGNLDPACARRVGAALARLHGGMRWIGGASGEANLPRELPGFLEAHREQQQQRSELPPARRELLTVIRHSAPIARALDALRESWRFETWIHWDCKLDNWLAGPSGIRLIDWELAGAGDPAWDTGTVLQSYWNGWVMQPSAVELNAVRPALRAFWDAYLGGSGSAATTTLERSMSFAGARMLQTAFESLQHEPAMTPAAVRMLQMAANVLAHPRAAALEMLGVC